MTQTITIEITDTEYKGLQYVSTDPQEWVDNAVTNRCRLAVDEIVDIVVKYCLDNQIQVPATREAIVTYAYDNDIIVTASEQNQQGPV
jgi:hypothetical protein